MHVTVGAVRPKYFGLAFYTLLPVRLIADATRVCGLYFRYKPSAIISTGPGLVVLPALLIRLTGGVVIHIETWSRFETASLTGRVMYHLSSVFMSKTESYLTDILEQNIPGAYDLGNSRDHPFDELVKAVDMLVISGHDVRFQIGHGARYTPRNYAYDRYMKDFDSVIEKSDLIITHAGAGNVFSILEMRKRVLVVPNLLRTDKHQSDLGDILRRISTVLFVGA